MKKMRAQKEALERSKHKHRLQGSGLSPSSAEISVQVARAQADRIASCLPALKNIRALHFNRARLLADKMRAHASGFAVFPPRSSSVQVAWLASQLDSALEPGPDMDAPPTLLHNELVQFCRYARLSRAEFAARTTVMQELLDAVCSKWPRASVHAFGSFPTDLSIYASDLDISVRGMDDDAGDGRDREASASASILLALAPPPLRPPTPYEHIVKNQQQPTPGSKHQMTKALATEFPSRQLQDSALLSSPHTPPLPPASMRNASLSGLVQFATECFQKSRALDETQYIERAIERLYARIEAEVVMPAAYSWHREPLILLPRELYGSTPANTLVRRQATGKRPREDENDAKGDNRDGGNDDGDGDDGEGESEEEWVDVVDEEDEDKETEDADEEDEVENAEFDRLLQEHERAQEEEDEYGLNQDIELNLSGGELLPPPAWPLQTAAKISPEQRQRQLEHLKNLSGHVQPMGWCAQMEVRARARVPIIALVHRCGLHVDVSLGVATDDHTSLVEKIVLTCGHDRFFPVCAFLKVFLAQQELDTPFTGGLGSFKLYCMVGAVFQMMRDQALQQHQQKQQQSKDLFSFSPDLGLVLQTFFNYFGQRSNLNVSTVLKVRLPSAPGQRQRLSSIVEVEQEGLLSCAFDTVHKVGAVQQLLATASGALLRAIREAQGNAQAHFLAPFSILSRLIDASRLDRERQEHRERYERYPVYDMSQRIRVASEVLQELHRRVGFPCPLGLQEVYAANPSLVARLLSYQTVSEALGHLDDRGAVRGQRPQLSAPSGHGRKISEVGRYGGGYGGVVGSAMHVTTKAQGKKEKRKRGQEKRAENKKKAAQQSKADKKAAKKIKLT